ASLRGGGFDASFSLGDLAARTTAALSGPDRALVYAYHGDLDLTGHVRGPDSDSWIEELANVDRLARSIARTLPADAALLVTADHGMVHVRDPIDLDSDQADPGRAGAGAFLEGVRLVGGEPRDRHVYTEPG